MVETTLAQKAIAIGKTPGYTGSAMAKINLSKADFFD